MSYTAILDPLCRSLAAVAHQNRSGHHPPYNSELVSRGVEDSGYFPEACMAQIEIDERETEIENAVWRYC